MIPLGFLTQKINTSEIQEDLEDMLQTSYSIYVYSIYVYSIYVYSICVYSICVYSIYVYSIYVYSIYVYSRCVYSICVYSICVYSICVYSICFHEWTFASIPEALCPTHAFIFRTAIYFSTSNIQITKESRGFWWEKIPFWMMGDGMTSASTEEEHTYVLIVTKTIRRVRSTIFREIDPLNTDSTLLCYWKL